MTKSTAPKPSPPKPSSQPDKEQETRDAAARQPAKTNDADRDLVHGDGGDIGIKTTRTDISRDD